MSGATTKATLLGHKFSDTYATSTFAVDTFTLVGRVVLAIILRRSPQPEPPQYIAKLERQGQGVGEHMATNWIRDFHVLLVCRGSVQSICRMATDLANSFLSVKVAILSVVNWKGMNCLEDWASVRGQSSAMEHEVVGLYFCHIRICIELQFTVSYVLPLPRFFQH